MKIAILGPGAMGMIYGAYLSQHNEVTLVGRSAQQMHAVNTDGVVITEKNGEQKTYHPHAVVDSSDVGEVDVVILLVKAMHSRAALLQHKGLIGENTILMTLQNGTGHDSVLCDFARKEQIAVGITQDGGARVDGTLNAVRHTGVGVTYFGMLEGDNAVLAPVAQTFSACGFETYASDKMSEMVWMKLLTNTSSSVLSGVLQTPQGYCVDNAASWEITQQLIREAIAVAAADGVVFDADEQIARIQNNLENARRGLTGLYADLRDGRLTEVDTISGSVVRAGERYGVPTPTHRLMVQMVHAMEEKSAYCK